MTHPTPQDIERAKKTLETLRHMGGHWMRRVEVIAQALADERERCRRIVCPHTDERGTGRGIYDMQYKDCCLTAEDIRKGGV